MDGETVTEILDGYFSEPELAKQLGNSTRTLARWRRLGEGPAWTKIGPRIFYRESAVRKWIERQERAPVRAA